jgi:hypothetical protein
MSYRSNVAALALVTAVGVGITGCGGGSDGGTYVAPKSSGGSTLSLPDTRAALTPSVAKALAASVLSRNMEGPVDSSVKDDDQKAAFTLGLEKRIKEKIKRLRKAAVSAREVADSTEDRREEPCSVSGTRVEIERELPDLENGDGTISMDGHEYESIYNECVDQYFDDDTNTSGYKKVRNGWEKYTVYDIVIPDDPTTDEDEEERIGDKGTWEADYVFDKSRTEDGGENWEPSYREKETGKVAWIERYRPIDENIEYEGYEWWTWDGIYSVIDYRDAEDSFTDVAKDFTFEYHRFVKEDEEQEVVTERLGLDGRYESTFVPRMEDPDPLDALSEDVTVFVEGDGFMQEWKRTKYKAESSEGEDSGGEAIRVVEESFNGNYGNSCTGAMVTLSTSPVWETNSMQLDVDDLTGKTPSKGTLNITGSGGTGAVIAFTTVEENNTSVAGGNIEVNGEKMFEELVSRPQMEDVVLDGVLNDPNISAACKALLQENYDGYK